MIASKQISVNFADLKIFRDQLKRAGEGEVSAFAREFLTEMAWRALREIKKFTPVNTGLLRNSFQIGEILESNDGTFSVEVYTDIEYALHVEYGTKGHFVPGYWQGKNFVYDPAAKTGVYFKAQPGRFMMKIGIEHVEKQMQKHFERHAKRWMKKMFRGR